MFPYQQTTFLPVKDNDQTLESVTLPTSPLLDRMYRISEKQIFKLRTNVDHVIPFPYTVGATKVFELRLTNFSTSKQLWRVKVTDNGLFDLDPPTGIINQQEEQIVKVTFRGDPRPTVVPAPAIHHLAIYHTQYPFKKSKQKIHKDSDEAWTEVKDSWYRMNKTKPNRVFYEQNCARRYYLIDFYDAAELKNQPQEEEPYRQVMTDFFSDLRNIDDEQENCDYSPNALDEKCP